MAIDAERPQLVTAFLQQGSLVTPTHPDEPPVLFDTIYHTLPAWCGWKSILARLFPETSVPSRKFVLTVLEFIFWELLRSLISQPQKHVFASMFDFFTEIGEAPSLGASYLLELSVLLF
jgi:hypothetical protein